MQARLILAMALAAFALTSCSSETLSEADADAQAKWTLVEKAYQNRAEVLPDLTPAIAAAEDDEKEMLSMIEGARQVALKATIETDDLDDPVAMAAFAQTQAQFDASVGRVMNEFDGFPELAAMASKQLLEQDFQRADAEIDDAVDAYNAAVAHYNEKANGFPQKFLGANELVPLRKAN